eukprot:2828926-Alexandrium_andersonii.AAC.1
MCIRDRLKPSPKPPPLAPQPCPRTQLALRATTAYISRHTRATAHRTKSGQCCTGTLGIRT